MAFTVSTTADDTIFGNARVRYLRVTADGATEALSTGLDVVYSVSYTPQSMATALAAFAINEGVAGTATNGAIGITGVASGDEMLLVVYGR